LPILNNPLFDFYVTSSNQKRTTLKKYTLIFLFFLALSAFQCDEENPNDACIDPDRISSGVCTLEYEPVCGCDMQTYGNQCAAENAGVKSWTAGTCK
jgi:hypothetical protein